MRFLLSFVFLSLIALTSAQAATLPKNMSSCGLDIAASFREGAPVDRFRIENRSSKIWSINSVTLNLEPSAGKMIFDTEKGGSGVEVFQPYKEVSGAAKMRWLSKLEDGGNLLTMDFNRFEAGQHFEFSIDVDDQLTQSELGQIRVSGNELEGAKVELVLKGPGGVIAGADMAFDKNAKAVLKGRTCS